MSLARERSLPGTWVLEGRQDNRGASREVQVKQVVSRVKRSQEEGLLSNLTVECLLSAIPVSPGSACLGKGRGRLGLKLAILPA